MLRLSSLLNSSPGMAYHDLRSSENRATSEYASSLYAQLAIDSSPRRWFGACSRAGMGLPNPPDRTREGFLSPHIAKPSRSTRYGRQNIYSR